jgi:ribosomal protein S18 acetylase RimI-like enzyme
MAKLFIYCCLLFPETIFMCIVRDYKHQDFNSTLNLMSFCPNSPEVESEKENWERISKMRAFNPQFHTFVAEKDENVIGMCFADVKRDETGRINGLIRHIIVDPKFRGQGIASKLVIQAVNFFLDLKIYNIRVQVSNKIKEVIPLFEKFNFKCNAIVMEKDVLKIREYRESDYEATKELMQVYSELIHVSFDENEWIRTLKIRMKSPQYRTLISEFNGNITGMALINIYIDEMGHTIGSLENVIIYPDYRARGFGKDLLMRAIEVLNALNVDKIRITAHLDIKNNLKIFEDVGFQMVASIMELKLT